jgi:hypothetical protein
VTEKKTPSRYYIVNDKQSQSRTYVKAHTPAQAVNYATRDRFSIAVATPDDMIGVDRASILDATAQPAVHPDQQKLEGV